MSVNYARGKRSFHFTLRGGPQREERTKIFFTNEHTFERIDCQRHRFPEINE